LTLEVLHYIEETVIHIRLIVELDFDLVEVGKGILEGKAVSDQRNNNGVKKHGLFATLTNRNEADKPTSSP
jgi:hypothetical protein